MGFFDKFKKKRNKPETEGEVEIQSISFKVGPETREINEDGVRSLEEPNDLGHVWEVPFGQ